MTTSLDPSTLFTAPPPPSSLASRVNGVSTPAAPKAPKPAAQAPRVDLEPLYTALKATISEYWAEYKDAVALFVFGKLNLSELALRTDHFLAGDPHVEHLHNRLLAGLLANVGREPPDVGVASWVSANDKPTAGLTKSTAGNEAERRLKTEVMQLPARERRRLKDIPEPENRNPVPRTVVAYRNAKQLRPPSDIPPASAGGLNRTNWDLEIRKRYNQPLAAETGEFPDPDSIKVRMTPICYEEALPNGAASECAEYVSTATEFYIKEVLSNFLQKTRANMAGGSVNAVQLPRFKAQLMVEEDGASRGEVNRVGGPAGPLPVEAREAAMRRSVCMDDLRLAMRTGDSTVGPFQFVQASVEHAMLDGEYEEYEDRRHEIAVAAKEQDASESRRRKLVEAADKDVAMNGVETNGVHDDDTDDGSGLFPDFEDDDDLGWDGGSKMSRISLASALDEVLSI